jgi:hypothetical protein
MPERMPSGEAGFMLIEVLMSAIVMLIVSAGIFGLLLRGLLGCPGGPSAAALETPLRPQRPQ